MNIKNYIWGYKPVIGSNDHYNATTSEKVIHDSKGRAYFSITYDEQKYDVDAETALNIILQYLFYTCLKDGDVSYDSFPKQLPRLLAKPHSVVISVCVNGMYHV